MLVPNLVETHAISPLHIQATASFISVLRQVSEQKNLRKRGLIVDDSEAVVMFASDDAS